MKCSLEGCDNPLGPDALEFTHKGVMTGGICEVCISSVPAIRVLLIKKNDLFHVEEMTLINRLSTSR
jgi:hypothetical protein